MSFAQEMKDFTAGFKAMSETLHDAERGRRESRRIDLEERRVGISEQNTDWTQKQRIAEQAGFESYEQMQEHHRKFGTGGTGGTGEGGTTAPPSDLSSNEIYTGFMDTVKAEVQNPFALAVIASTGKRESGFSPGNANREWDDGKHNAGGIMSWNGPRLAALKAHNGGVNGTPQQQAQFFLKESPELITKLNNAKSLEEAQQIMNNAWGFKGYNQPNHPETKARLAASRGFLPTFQGGSKVAAAATAEPKVTTETPKPKGAIPTPEEPAEAETKPDVIEVPPIEDVASPVPVPEERPQEQSWLTPEEEEPNAWLKPRPMFAAAGGVIPEYYADGGTIPSTTPPPTPTPLPPGYAERPAVDPYSATRHYTQPQAAAAPSSFVPRRISAPPASTWQRTTPGIQGRVTAARAGLVAQRKAAADAAAAAAALKAQQDAAAAAAAAAAKRAPKAINRNTTRYREQKGWGERAGEGRGPSSRGAGYGGVSSGGKGLWEEGGIIPMNFADGGRVRDEDELEPLPEDSSRFGDRPVLQDEGVSYAQDRPKAEPRPPVREPLPNMPSEERLGPRKGAIPDVPPPVDQGPSGPQDRPTIGDATGDEAKKAKVRMAQRQKDYEKLPNREPAIKPASPAPTSAPPVISAVDQAPRRPTEAPPQTVAAETSRAGVIPDTLPEERPSNVVPSVPNAGISRANLPRQPAEVPVPRPVDIEQPRPVTRGGQPMENPLTAAPGTRGAPAAPEARPSTVVPTPMTPPAEPAIPVPPAEPAIPTPEEPPSPELPTAAEAPIPAERPTQMEAGLKLPIDDVEEIKKAAVSALTSTLPQQDGAVATPEDAAKKKVAAERLARNADAATAAEAKEVMDTVDPQGKLSEEERLIKSMMDQRDWFLAQGLPEKAQHATIAIAQYSRKMSQRFGALADEAIKRGDLDNAAKFMKRAYDNIPDGRSLSYTKKDDGTFDWKVTETATGNVVDEGNAGADDMREMSGPLMDGSGWISMMSQQALDYGVGTKGGKKTSIQERQELNERQAQLYADAVEAGKELAANPEDADAKEAFEKANSAYNATIGPRDEKDLARVYLDAGLPVPPGLAQTTSGSAKERAAKEDKDFYDTKDREFNEAKDPAQKLAIQKEVARRAYDNSKENTVKPADVEIAVDEFEEGSQQRDIYAGMIEDIVAHNKAMNATMAKKAVDYMATKGASIGRDGRVKAGNYSFVFNPDLLPSIQVLRKLNAAGKK